MKKKSYVIYCEKDIDNFGFLNNGEWNKEGYLDYKHEFSHSIDGAVKFYDNYLIESLVDCLSDDGFNCHILRY